MRISVAIIETVFTYVERAVTRFDWVELVEGSSIAVPWVSIRSLSFFLEVRNMLALTFCCFHLEPPFSAQILAQIPLSHSAIHRSIKRCLKS